mgnify:CR=1 FL=1
MGDIRKLICPIFVRKCEVGQGIEYPFLNQIQIFQRLADSAVFQGAGHIISL